MAALVPQSAHVRAIVFFNNDAITGFETTEECPDNKTPIAIAFDVSGSMSHHANEAKCVLAELTTGTNADKQFTVPVAKNQTGLVDAVAELSRIAPEAVKYVITDGQENCFTGKLAIGVNANTGEFIDCDMNNKNSATPAYVTNVAAHLEHVMGTKMILVGIGSDSDELTQAVAGNSATVVRIPRGSTQRDVAGALRHGTNVRSSTAWTATRSLGTGIILTTTPEAQAISESIPEEEINDIALTAGNIIISGNEPATKQEVLDGIRTAWQNCKNPVAEAEYKKIVAVILYFGELARVEGIPSAAVFGKFCGLLLEPPKTDMKRCFNQIIIKLGAKLFAKTGTTGDGAILTINDTTLKFPPKCDLYKCVIPAAVLADIAADREVCGDIVEFQKRSGASSGKKRPRDDATQAVDADLGSTSTA